MESWESHDPLYYLVQFNKLTWGLLYTDITKGITEPTDKETNSINSHKNKTEINGSDTTKIRGCQSEHL